MSPANIETTVVLERSEKPESRTARAHTRLKPSEFEIFTSHIGRQSVSDALRSLVLDFNRRKAAERKPAENNS